MDYQTFLEQKTQLGGYWGFEPIEVPNFLFPYQRELVEWATRKGRAAIFADCGMGKTPMALVWANNVVRHTNKPVLILTPLAVSHQFKREASKFGIEAEVSRDGEVKSHITITNYEKLHLFKSEDWGGAICDESGCIKNHNSIRKDMIIRFMRQMKYRLLCSATPSPNDYPELGNSSEALGHLGYLDMITQFFRSNDDAVSTRYNTNRWTRSQAFLGSKWRFKGHSETFFWRWVASWARAARKPSDLGFYDEDFEIPPLIEKHHAVQSKNIEEGMLFQLPARGLSEQRVERKRTYRERSEYVKTLVEQQTSQSAVWCHLNPEGDFLERIIPNAVQISGKDTDEEKEGKFIDFIDGKTKVLITKPKIGGFGLNLQNCHHATYFPTHSYESYYQVIRRFWRYGQTMPVEVDMVYTDGDLEVIENLNRKALAMDNMFTNLVKQMNNPEIVANVTYGENDMEGIPWLR